jgi:hypothetical protein
MDGFKAFSTKAGAKQPDIVDPNRCAASSCTLDITQAVQYDHTNQELGFTWGSRCPVLVPSSSGANLSAIKAGSALASQMSASMMATAQCTTGSWPQITAQCTSTSRGTRFHPIAARILA